MQRMAEIFKSFLGKQEIDGGEKSSWQKIWFQIANIVAYLLPTILYMVGTIDAAGWLDFYKIVIPTTLGLYALGKHVDNTTEQTGACVSWKRIWFQVASAVGYIVPTIMLVLKKIDGSMWLDFYKVIVPATLGLYIAGKYIDGKSVQEEEPPTKSDTPDGEEQQ